jgi:hypothetical protein
MEPYVENTVAVTKKIACHALSFRSIKYAGHDVRSGS